MLPKPRMSRRMIRLGCPGRVVTLFCLIAVAIPDRAATQISRNQMAIPENNAVILSAANRALHISYFDSAWKEIVVSPGATVALPCRNGTVPIVFSNGPSVSRTSLATGTQYVLFFDDTRQQWTIDTLDSLLDRSLKPN